MSLPELATKFQVRFSFVHGEALGLNWAAAVKKTPDYELWIWRGIRLEAPAGWEMLRFQREVEAGRCAWGDAWQTRLELSWRVVAAGTPDLTKLRQDALAWLREAGAVEVMAARNGDWLGARGLAHGQAFANFSRFFAEAGLLLEVFLWGAEADLESWALGGCRPVDAVDEGRWRGFGLDVRSDLPLRECQAYPGLTRLVFADRGDDPDRQARERLIVERRGMASSWLAAGATVASWNRAQAPGGWRREEGEVELEGTACPWVIGALRRKLLAKLAGRAWAVLRRRDYAGGNYLSLACAAPERNEVRRVEILTQGTLVTVKAAAGQLAWVSLPEPDGIGAVPLLIRRDPECTLAPPASWAGLLRARPVRNAAVEIERAETGVYLRIANVRPAWHRAPVSWVVPWRSHKRLALDALGAEIWRRCDGKTAVLELVHDFAKEHRVTFHEARVAVSQYLRTLIERGLIAMAGGGEAALKP